MGRKKRKQKSEAGEKRLCPCSVCVPIFARVHRTNVLKHFLTNGVHKGPQHQPSNDAWPVPRADDPDFLTYLMGKFQLHWTFLSTGGVCLMIISLTCSFLMKR